MNRIRHKTLVIVIVVLLTMLGGFYLFLQEVFLDKFKKDEKERVRINMERVLNALQEVSQSLVRSCSDYAIWDDTYRFVQDGNRGYIQSNFSDNLTFENNLWSMVVIVNLNGEIVYSHGHDLSNKTEMPLPPDLKALLQTGTPLLKHDSPDSHVEGILNLSTGPMLVASHPIVNSHNQGPIRGTFIVGRQLDRDEVQRLSKVTLLALNSVALSQVKLSNEYLNAYRNLEQNEGVYITPLSTHVIAGFVLLKGISGGPVLILRAEMDRVLYAGGLSVLKFVLWAFLLLGIVLCVVLVGFLERTVLSRIEKLSTFVDQLGSENSDKIISIGGKDEITKLASNIQMMLSRVKSTQSKLEESEKKFNAFMENLPAPTFIKAENGLIEYINPAFEKSFHVNSKEIIGKTDFEIWAPESAAQFRHNDLSVLQSGAAGEFFEAVPMPNGIPRLWKVYKFSIHGLDGAKHLGGMAFDITEENRAIEMTKESEARFRVLADHSPVMIWMSGGNGLFNFLNQTWLQFTGRNLEEEIGEGWLGGVYPADQEKIRQEITDSRNKKKNLNLEIRIKRFDGKFAWIRMQGVPRLNPQGDFLGLVGSAMDISEIKNVENILAKYSHSISTLYQTKPKPDLEWDLFSNQIKISQEWLEDIGSYPREGQSEMFFLDSVLLAKDFSRIKLWLNESKDSFPEYFFEIVGLKDRNRQLWVGHSELDSGHGKTSKIHFKVFKFEAEPG